MSTRARRRQPAVTAGEEAWSLPLQEAQADAAITRDSLPFVVQAGQMLYLVAAESTDWVVAELHFDPVTCTFAEDRRAHFRWPREAFGRLVSRTLIGGDFDGKDADAMTDAFGKWLVAQFVA